MHYLNKIIVFTILLVALIGCGQEEKPQVAITPVTTITTAAAKTSQLEISQTIVGTIESRETPVIASEVAGKVNMIYADAGDLVTKDQHIAKIDDAILKINLDESITDVTRLKAQVNNQRLTVARYTTLVKQQTQAQSQLDASNTELKSLQAQLDKAQSHVEEVRIHLAKTIIKSPVKGYIQKRYISVGDFVNVGAPVAALVTIDKLQAKFILPETMRNKIKKGLTVKLSSPTSPNENITAQITEITPMLDLNNRGIQATSEFNNPGSFQPGASVDIKIILGKRDNALMLPEKAVVNRPKGSVVYVILDDTAVEKVVKIGEQYDGEIEIIDGISAGMEYALDGAGFLTNGTKVSIKNK